MYYDCSGGHNCDISIGGRFGGYNPPESESELEPCTCTICTVCGSCFDDGLKSAGTTASDCPAACLEHTKEQTARSQLEYLKQRGCRELAEVFEQLLLDSSLPMSDVYAIYAAIEKAYLQLKAEYVMAVFSPDNVATILALYLSSSISESTKIKTLNLLG